MDFLQARDGAEDRAIGHGAAASPAPSTIPFPEPLPVHAVPAGAPSAATAPTDPLDEFFWREDERAPALPDILGVPAMPPPAEVPETRREWLTFLLGGEEYGIPIDHVREILKAPVLTEVPRAPPHVLGVIMVRGEVIAVVDPRHRLGAGPAPADRKARVLVCDPGDGPRGLLVDAVSQVVRLTPSTIEPRPSGLGGPSGEHISGIGRDRGRLVVLLDTAALLGDPGQGRPAERAP